MGILDELEQGETPPSTPSTTSGPTSAEVVDAVNRQTRAVNDLKTYLQVVIEETVKEELKSLPSTSPPSGATSQQIKSVESRIDGIASRMGEIEKTLGAFSKSLDGERLTEAARTLTAAATRQRTASTRASDRAAAEVEHISTELAGLRAQVQRASTALDIERQVRDAAKRLTEPLNRLESLTGRVDRLSTWSWTLGGRLLAGGVLLLVALAVVTGVLSGFAQLIGVPEIAGAIWTAFEATDSWWGQTLWALAGFAFAGAVVVGAWRLIRWLVDSFG